MENTTSETLIKDLNALKKDVNQLAADVKHQAGAHVDATRQMVVDKIQLAREAAAARPLFILGTGFLLGFLFALRVRK